MYTDKLGVFDFVQSQKINPDCEIQDFDEYIIVDDFFENVDESVNQFLKYPVDMGEDLYQKLFATGAKEWEMPKLPGFSQPLPVLLFERVIFEIYKFLIDCEFLPQRANENLMNPMFASQLASMSMVHGSIFHPNMIINKNANNPSPAMGEYWATIFFDDSTEDNKHGVSLYDFVYNNKRYSCLDDITLETDKKLLSEMGDFLNIKNGVTKELVEFTPFESNSFFDETRFIPAKKNRLVITRGGNWINQTYKANEETYQLIFSFNEPKNTGK